MVIPWFKIIKFWQGGIIATIPFNQYSHEFSFSTDFVFFLYIFLIDKTNRGRNGKVKNLKRNTKYQELFLIQKVLEENSCLLDKIIKILPNGQ